jgi:hypothetical protein
MQMLQVSPSASFADSAVSKRGDPGCETGDAAGECNESLSAGALDEGHDVIPPHPLCFICILYA